MIDRAGPCMGKARRRARLELARACVAAVVAGLVPAPACAAGDDDTAPAEAKLMRIVALGDSTTATAQDWAPQIEKVYADCLPAALAARGIRAEVVNAGIGDTTTRDAVARLDHDVRRHHPDLVVVQFGINDSWIDADEGRTRPRLTRAGFRRNLEHIIRTLELDGARIVLMTPNPMRWYDPYYVETFEQHPGLLDTHAVRGLDALLDRYAEDARAVARAERVALVDVLEAFESYGKVPGQSIGELLLAGDGIHPNAAGQRLVCRLLTARIVELLAPGAPPSVHSP
jgi:lysophospholipase L1-like esterase